MMRCIQFLFGFSLLIFGLNGFIKFIPLPEKQHFAKIFLETLHEATYLLPTIACLQICTALCLLCNRWVNLGLLVLLPISYNIFFFHVLHDRAALVPAMGILGLNLFLIYDRAEAIKPCLQK